VLTSILDAVKSVDASLPGAFYRDELTMLLDRKMTDI
jgi:hypothetical protein